MGQKRYGWLKDFVLPVVVGVVVAFGIKTYVATAAVVPSASMYPTIPATSLQQFSVITVNKLATEFGGIYRGEVVTFHWPDNPSKIFVKRVIGLPGDTVTVTENAVYINGKKLNEANIDIAKSNGTCWAHTMSRLDITSCLVIIVRHLTTVDCGYINTLRELPSPVRRFL